MTDLLYEGKAKKIFAVPGETDKVLVEYKDSLTAFNALKKGSFENKGSLNRDITSLIFRYLSKKGVETHWLEDRGERSMLVRRVEIIPLEVVVRNILAGSTAKKLGIAEGKKLSAPLVEIYLKNDELQDPFLSDDQALMLEVVKSSELQEIKANALVINRYLQELFLGLSIQLVDFKIEFGRDGSRRIVLADEISPDCCRLWDLKTGEKLDKDRFRRDLGNIRESYREVFERLKNHLGGQL